MSCEGKSRDRKVPSNVCIDVIQCRTRATFANCCFECQLRENPEIGVALPLRFQVEATKVSLDPSRSHTYLNSVHRLPKTLDETGQLGKQRLLE